MAADLLVLNAKRVSIHLSLAFTIVQPWVEVVVKHKSAPLAHSKRKEDQNLFLVA